MWESTADKKRAHAGGYCYYRQTSLYKFDDDRDITYVFDSLVPGSSHDSHDTDVIESLVHVSDV